MPASFTTCGLDVRLGTTDNRVNSRKLLEDLDLVADFSLPTGASSHVRSQITVTVTNISRFAPAGEYRLSI